MSDKETNVPSSNKILSDAFKAKETTLKGWHKFKNWKRNDAFLRTIGGLLAIAFCLNWAVAGATFAFCFKTHTKLILNWLDTVITALWNSISVYLKLMVILLGIVIIIFGSYTYVSIFLFPIQLIANVCAFKLGMDLSTQNMKKRMIRFIIT